MRVFLNPILVKKQNLSKDAQENIIKLHDYRQRLFAQMEKAKEKDLPSFVPVIEKWEFMAQKAWGFPQDRNYHMWWYNCPRCTCPKSDNGDRYGTPYRVIEGSCPVHGKKK